MKRSSSTAKNRVTRKRAKRQSTNAQVTPLAVKTSETSPEVFIPAVVNSGPGSTEAVISVEVKRPGRSTRRRAAVIPIRVRSQSKSDQHTEARAEQKYEGSARRREERRRWSDPVTDLVVTATFVGEGVMTIAHQAGLAAVDMVENVYRMLFDPQTVIAELKRGKLSGYTALLESPPEFYGESRAA